MCRLRPPAKTSKSHRRQQSHDHPPTLTDADRAIFLETLAASPSIGDPEAILNDFLHNTVSNDTVRMVMDLLADRLMRSGFNEDWEPIKLGHALEQLISFTVWDANL